MPTINDMTEILKKVYTQTSMCFRDTLARQIEQGNPFSLGLRSAFGFGFGPDCVNIQGLIAQFGATYPEFMGVNMWYYPVWTVKQMVQVKDYLDMVGCDGTCLRATKP